MSARRWSRSFVAARPSAAGFGSGATSSIAARACAVHTSSCCPTVSTPSSDTPRCSSRFTYSRATAARATPCARKPAAASLVARTPSHVAARVVSTPATYLGTGGRSSSPSRVAVTVVFSSARRDRAHLAQRRVSLRTSGACSTSSTSAATSSMKPSEPT